MTASPQAPTLFRDRLMEAPCTKCGAKMTLARIEPDKPGYDLRTLFAVGAGRQGQLGCLR
jgi:hypothetical protein